MNKILQGDCLETLKTLPDNSIDAIVTDPPYGLSFMGKKWDYDVPKTEVWKECLRVLKPGGYLLSFAGTRTQHRMAVNIEDAGFEIRDMIAWVYGSGFPKSLNIGKAVDKRGGQSVSWFGKWLREWREENNITQKEISKLFPSKTGGLTGCVANWELGFNMPTNEQFNLICKTFSLPFKSLEEAEREIVGKTTTNKTVYQNIGGDNVSGEIEITKGTSEWEGWGTALKPALEPITVARKPIEGTVAENCLKWGVGGINIDGCRVGTEESLARPYGGENKVYGKYEMERGTITGEGLTGRFPANFIHDGSDEVVSLFPNDNSRFFYCAKASKSERNKGCEKNGHPTIKPIALMEYLIKLVSKEGHTILDPFAGSGSTLIAAKKLKRNYIGCELDPEYIKIAEARLSAVKTDNKLF